MYLGSGYGEDYGQRLSGRKKFMRLPFQKKKKKAKKLVVETCTCHPC
jgi:hypothetical protein